MLLHLSSFWASIKLPESDSLTHQPGTSSESESVCSILRTRVPPRQGVQRRSQCLSPLCLADTPGGQLSLAHFLLTEPCCRGQRGVWNSTRCSSPVGLRRGVVPVSAQSQAGWEWELSPGSGIPPSQNQSFLLCINPNRWDPIQKIIPLLQLKVAPVLSPPENDT